MVVVDPKFQARTERLLLRPLVIEDAADVLLMRKDPNVMKHTPLMPSDDIEKTKEWVQGCFQRDNNWNFAVELMTPHDGPRVIGLVGAVRTPEIGYMFNSNYWGHGYATEALRAFMPLFFENFSGGESARHDYAVALTDTELVVSQNVLTKVGFTLYERKDKDFENPVLGWRDTFFYRMYRPDPKATMP